MTKKIKLRKWDTNTNRFLREKSIIYILNGDEITQNDNDRRYQFLSTKFESVKRYCYSQIVYSVYGLFFLRGIISSGFRRSLVFVLISVSNISNFLKRDKLFFAFWIILVDENTVLVSIWQTKCGYLIPCRCFRHWNKSI